MIDNSDILPFDRSGWTAELQELKHQQLWFKSSATVEETSAQKADAKVGIEEWNEYATEWAPKIQRYAKDIASDKTAEKEQAVGITNADIAQGTAGTDKALTGYGMSPNSGRSVSALSKTTDKLGTVGAGAGVSAEQGVESAQVGGLQQVANIGMGQKTEAVDGMYDIAKNSVSEAITDAGLDQQEHQENVGLGMSAAGVATGIGMDYFANKQPAATANNYLMTHNNTANGPLWRP